MSSSGEFTSNSLGISTKSLQGVHQFPRVPTWGTFISPLRKRPALRMMHRGHSPNKHFACNYIRGATTLQLAAVLQRDQRLPQVSPHLPDTSLWPGTTHLPTQLQNISDTTWMKQQPETICRNHNFMSLCLANDPCRPPQIHN